MDPEQLGRLIDELADALVLYARQWCDEPEDVVQEALVKLAGLPVSPHNPAAWLFRAVRNRAVNAGVARRRRSRHEAEASAGAAAWFEPARPDRAGDAVDAVAAQEALAAIPVEQREVIVAHLWGGLTFGEIAEVAGSSSSTVHRLYHAGLAALRERLGVPCRPSPSRPKMS
jgi:RNA polymerase sigma-70 factor (ECF subfamily)